MMKKLSKGISKLQKKQQLWANSGLGQNLYEEYFLILQKLIQLLDLTQLFKTYEFCSNHSEKYQVKQILQDCSNFDLINLFPLRIRSSTDLQEFPFQCFLLLWCRLIKLAISNQIMNGADLGQSFFYVINQQFKMSISKEKNHIPQSFAMMFR